MIMLTIWILSKEDIVLTEHSFLFFPFSLRLQLYRGLGIEMIENDLGVYSKARIRKESRRTSRMLLTIKISTGY